MTTQSSEDLKPGPWEEIFRELGAEPPAFEDRSLGEFLEDHARNIPDNIALTYVDHQITYLELNRLTNQLANALVQEGVKKGDVIGVQMPNLPQYVIALLAAAKVGASVSGLSLLLSPPEFKRQAEDANAKVLFLFEPLAKVMLPSDDKVPSCTQTVIVSGASDFTDGAAPELPGLSQTNCVTYQAFTDGADTEFQAVSLPPDHVMLIQYTGGTTGPSKGALLTLRGVMHNAALSHVYRPWEVGKESVSSGLPLFHVGGMIIAIMSLRYGGHFLLFLDPRNMDHFCEQMIKYPPTRLAGVPTTYQMIADHPASKDVDFSKVRVAQTGAAPITGSDRARIERMLHGTVLTDGFGMTETGPTVISNPPQRCKPEALGCPLPGVDIRIVDAETGTREMTYGEPGEIIASSPCLMAGYLNRPEETENALRQWHGKTWMFTGDIGIMDPEGYVYIRDRKKDMIIVSGFKVFSAEVENEVAEIDAIAMSALIGQPDEARPGSEVVHLYVELTKEARQRDEESVRSEILEFCRANLARYKVPKQIHFIDAIPLTAVGKVDKKVLRAGDFGA